jgi:hypothetical protein
VAHLGHWQADFPHAKSNRPLVRRAQQQLAARRGCSNNEKRSIFGFDERAYNRHPLPLNALKQHGLGEVHLLNVDDRE